MGTAGTVPDPAGRHAAPADRAGEPGTGTAGTVPRRRGRLRAWADEHDAALWWAIWSITAVANWIAASGQVDVWAWAGLPHGDTRRFGVPFLMEIAVVGWLLIGRLAVKHGRSPFPWWAVAAGFSAIAIYTNCAHGTQHAALIFGTASALAIALWFAKFYLDFVGLEIADGRRAAPRPKVLFTARTVETPRLRWRAHLITGRIGHHADGRPLTVDDAIGLADLWRDVYDDALAAERAAAPGTQRRRSSRRADRRYAKRAAWDAVKLECGVKVIERTGLKIRKTTFLTPTSTPDNVPPDWTAREKRDPRRPANLVHPDAPVSPAPAGAGREPLPGEPEQYAAQIAAVKALARDGWWAGDKPLKVDQVQDLGVRNRAAATAVAACLRAERRERRRREGLPT